MVFGAYILLVLEFPASRLFFAGYDICIYKIIINFKHFFMCTYLLMGTNVPNNAYVNHILAGYFYHGFGYLNEDIQLNAISPVFD